MERTPRVTRCRPDFPAPLVCAERREHGLTRFYHRTCGEHKRAMATTEHRGVSQPSQVLQREEHDRSSFTRNSCKDHIPLSYNHPPIVFFVR